MKQRLLLLLTALLVVAAFVPVRAQQKTKFAVAGFGQDPFDTTPTNPDYEKTDGNGARYAIIKVTSTNPEDDLRAYRFNFGNLNSLVEEHDGQLWVYVQRNAKLVTISREGYQTIDKHDLGLTIEAGKTYIMQLASAGIAISRQTVMFNVSPADANATIVIKSEKPGAREETLGTTNASGMVGKNLELGTYTYRIVANNFQPTEGRITLNDKSNVHIEAVTLQDKLYPLTLTSAPSNSKVYLKGEYLGNTPYTGQYATGDYYFEMKHVNNLPVKWKVHLDKDSTEHHVTLEKQYLKRYSVYLQGFMGTGMKSNTNVGFGIGAYLKNFNLEFDYAAYSCFSNIRTIPDYSGIMKSEPKHAILIKLGYGLDVGKHFRITPQIGVFNLREKNSVYEDGYLWSLSIGARFEYVPVRHFGLFLSPNGQIMMWNFFEGNGAAKYFSGFDLKFGMFVSF